jgi:Domain of unknown function (DUF1818)
MDTQWRSGQGWRLAYRPGSTYPALLGGTDWAIELSAPELTDFCRLLHQLADTMEQIQSELMAEETIDCEAESDRLWLQVSGYPHSYTLRLLLNTGRKAEGNWDTTAVPPLIAATRQIFPS